MSSELINDTVYKNSGNAIHSFGLSGAYIVSFESDYSIDEIRNVTPSEGAKLYMEVIFTTFIEPITNTAPVCEFILLDFIIDDACYITQSRQAIDAEGDSITYNFELFTVEINDTTSSTFPEATDSIGINLFNGDFYWRNAIYKDKYGLQYTINEYRDGDLLGTSMQKIITDINCGIVSTTNLKPSNFVVFPNPVTDNLELPSLQTPITRCIIYDVIGRAIVEIIPPINNQLNVAALAPGIYTICLMQGDALSISRFTKL